ncbi:MAG: hypothetical protein HPY50_18180 [Firmicutes bacterium]|nr:hypothetical protein [Bacillota bacterium]
MEVLKTVCELMALSARTAPKARGRDYIETRVVAGEDLVRLGEAMIKYGQEKGKASIERDGKNVLNSTAVLLLALKDAVPAGLNCGACGSSICAEIPPPTAGPEFEGTWCTWRITDLGIAIGSAVKTASLHNADNRVMYSVGVLARKLGLIPGQVVVGIPVSATGKSIYYDR